MTNTQANFRHALDIISEAKMDKKTYVLLLTDEKHFSDMWLAFSKIRGVSECEDVFSGPGWSVRLVYGG